MAIGNITYEIVLSKKKKERWKEGVREKEGRRKEVEERRTGGQMKGRKNLNSGHLVDLTPGPLEKQ